MRSPARSIALRRRVRVGEAPLVVTLAATDPANPYGALLPWPEWPATGAAGWRRTRRRRCAPPARPAPASCSSTAHSRHGSRAATGRCSSRCRRTIPTRARGARAGPRSSSRSRIARQRAARGWLIEEINGRPQRPILAPFLLAAGFAVDSHGASAASLAACAPRKSQHRFHRSRRDRSRPRSPIPQIHRCQGRFRDAMSLKETNLR